MNQRTWSSRLHSHCIRAHASGVKSGAFKTTYSLVCQGALFRDDLPITSILRTSAALASCRHDELAVHTRTEASTGSEGGKSSRVEQIETSMVQAALPYSSFNTRCFFSLTGEIRRRSPIYVCEGRIRRDGVSITCS